jgi:hypothetical protein
VTTLEEDGFSPLNLTLEEDGFSPLNLKKTLEEDGLKSREEDADSN